MADERTPHLNMPLPAPANRLQDDVQRLRAALLALDAACQALQAATAAAQTASAQALAEHVASPAAHSKQQVGLGRVDNTSDLDKPISAATQQALSGKQPVGNYWRANPAPALRSSAFDAAANTAYDCDTSAGAFALTLPASPAVGDWVGINDNALTFGAAPLTLARNGQPIEGAHDDLLIDKPWRGMAVFRGGARGWVLI